MTDDAPPGLNGHYDLRDCEYSDLVLLQGDVEAEIAVRDALVEAEKRRVREQEASLKDAANERVEAWVEYERVQCGKPTCKCATQGKSFWHGPYWYMYLPTANTESGRTSTYVGRQLTPEAAKILDKHDAKREAREALVKGEFRHIKSSDELAGLYPEEVYPEDFTEDERDRVASKRDREEGWG